MVRKTMFPCDANQDGKTDFLIYPELGSPKLFLQGEDGAFEDLAENSGTHTSLLENAEPGAACVADVNGDGKDELLIAVKNLSRALVVSDGGLKVVDQFSGQGANAEISAVAAGDLDGDRKPEILLFDKRGKQVTVLRNGGEGAYAIRSNLSCGRAEYNMLKVADMNGDGKADVFLAGPKDFGVFPLDCETPGLEEIAFCETKVPGGSYGMMAVGDVNSDGKKDVVLTETNRHYLEILTYEGPGRLTEGTRFKVFEEKRYAAPGAKMGAQPQEVIVGDLTNDKKDDIAIIVHDRAILYPQE